MTGRKLELVVSTDVGRLFEAAADGFLQPLRSTPATPFPSPPYLLALRQGGLRDDLIRLAARRGCTGWFDPPLCIFHELPRWLGEPALPTLGEVERLALLGSVVRAAGGEVFGRLRRLDYYIGALDSFFGELVSEGTTPDEFVAAVEPLLRVTESFASRKNSELVRIYRSYRSALDEAGVRDGRDSLAAAAELLAQDESGLAERLGGRSEIRFHGLADLRGGWRILLTLLTRSAVIEKVRVYTTREFGDSELSSLPPLEITRLDGRPNAAAALFRGAQFLNRRPARASFAVIEAPNTDREIGEVAIRVRQLIDNGVPPSRIAVVARRGRPLVDLTVQALALCGVPATARLRVSFNEIPVVKAIQCLLAAAAEGWTRERLAELAGIPHFVPLLDAAVLNFIGYRQSVRGLRSWRTAMEDLQERTERVSGSEEEEEHARQRHPSAGQVVKAREGFDRFQKLVSGLDDKKRLIDWVTWLESFVADDRFEVEKHIYSVPESELCSVRRDLAGWRGLHTILREWKDALSRWGDVGSPDPASANQILVGEFSKRLREMLDGQVGLWTETHRGVQVLEVLAAAYREFDFVFLVGMEAGAFPLAAPRSPILDDEDRSVIREGGIHLDNRADWDSRERDLFRTLVSGAQHLTVSYPAISLQGADTIRSSFVEALAEVADENRQAIEWYAAITPGTQLVHSAAGRLLAGHAATIEYARQLNDATPFNGNIENSEIREWLAATFDDNRLWSPSQIEAYAKCPWAYFSGRLLRMEKFADPDEDMEATVRGSLLHATLARFYNRAGNERGRPVFLRTADLAWAEPLMEETLDSVFGEMAERVWMGHPVLRDSKRTELKRELCRYLAWEVEFHDRMEDHKKSDSLLVRTGADSHELSFGESGDIVMERKGVRFRFRGTIDRVDRGVDARIDNPTRFVAAIDYKSSISGVPGGGTGGAWDDGVVLQVPLYAYALTEIHPETTVSRVEYQPLHETKPGAFPGRARPHCLQLYQVDKKTGILERNEEDAEKMELALDNACEHVINARHGKFPVSPAPSCGCPSYCHGFDVCRVPAWKREGRRP